jgi:hypothetical protein
MYAVAGRWMLEPSSSGPSINLTYVVFDTTTRRPSGPHRGQEPSPA